MLFLANMQIISLNMHDTKMAQAKIDSTEKNWSRNNKETVGTYIYRFVMGISLSIDQAGPKHKDNHLRFMFMKFSKPLTACKIPNFNV